jgi:hypothetical protein
MIKMIKKQGIKEKALTVICCNKLYNNNAFFCFLKNVKWFLILKTLEKE